MSTDIYDPPHAYGKPLFRAILKQIAADFRVDESLDIDFSDNGEHLYLQIEKTAMNTDEVVELLQHTYSLESADIGMCGLKDRHAITTQWFSVKTPLSADIFQAATHQYNEQQRAAELHHGGFVKQMLVIQQLRHQRKLRHGAHTGNRFCIVLHDVESIVEEHGLQDEQMLTNLVSQRLSDIEKKGFPAYIGAQRFGKDGQNLQRARQWFANPKKRLSRRQRGLYLSSARSYLFNRVLAARVHDGSWNQLMAGEPAMLDGSRSFFTQDAQSASADSLEQRLRSFDIHPSAPWWGRGRSAATGDCALYEVALLADEAELCLALERAGLEQERRAVRAQVKWLEHRWQKDNVLELKFFLAPGVFATTLLRELCTVSEPQR